MKSLDLVIALGGYMLLMGLFGYYRTHTPTPLFINGGIAIVTIIIGIFLKGGSPTVLNLAIGWIGLNTLMLAYMTFKRIAAHSDVRSGSEYIFGTQAVFALIVLIVLVRYKIQTPN
ncbi:MAG: hypothetical protein SGI97_05800 [candidate division Zixibacteria bacterium]|nr:hypothetical protein [candidate division Zixibacteria bacterium]